MTQKRKTTSILYQVSPVKGIAGNSFARVLVISSILGLLSLFFSQYGITTSFEGVKIDIPWSIILPILAGLIYGARGGFIAGFVGGIWFPFLLWPDNGYGNVVTAVAFLINFTAIGFASEKGEQDKNRIKSLFIVNGIIIVNLTLWFRFAFSYALSLNPAFWVKFTVNSLPLPVINTFIVKDSINFILFILSADSLLHFPPLRRLLGLETGSIYRKNTAIFGYVSLVTVFSILIFKALVITLIHGEEHHRPEYFSIFLLMMVPGGFLVAGAICKYVERFLIVQEELMQNEKKFRSYIEGSPNGVFVTDVEGKFKEVNNSFSEMTGYSTEELLRLNIFDMIDSSSRMTAFEQLRSMLTGEKVNKEYKYSTKLGEQRWWSASTVRLSEGRSLVFVVDITKIKLAEEVILQSENKLKQAERFAKLGHFEIDLESWVVNASAETFRIVGVPPDNQREYPLREFVSCIHTDERDEIVAQFMKAYRTKSPINFIYRIFAPDGTEKYIHSFAAFRTDGQGNRPRLFGIFQDITAFKKAELDLQERESRFRVINEMVTDWASQYRLNDDGSMTREWIVGTVDKFTGTTTEERDSTGGWYNMVHPDDLQMLIEKNKAAIETGTTQTFEYRALHKNGEIIYLFNKVRPIIDAATGKATHLVIAGRNITEAKEAELAKKKSERNFGSIFEMAPFSLIVSSLEDGLIIIANKYAYEFFETSPEEVTTAREFYYDYSDRDRMVRQMRETGMIENLDMRVVTKKGKIKWISMSARIVEVNNERLLLSVMADIGPQKQALEQVTEAKIRAEEASKMKSSFLANMSHELRTPLIGIMGYAEIIDSLVDEPDIKKMTHTIFTSGERLKNTLNLILDLSKVEANQIEINPTHLNLVEEFSGAVKLFEAAAYKKGLALKSDFQSDILPALLDARLIHDIANNLLNNAIKFTRHGEICVRGYAEVKGGREYVIIQVSDTGIGIAAKDKDIIFEDFRQASEGLSRSFEGTGLGLALTKRYVLLMGGTISVESVPGEGTTFTLHFPRVELQPAV